jgi:putative zinc ribbon protein
MPEKCISCGSCGMPMEKPEDFALGDVTRPYCAWCTDARGELLPYETVLETNARIYEQSQGVTSEAAKRLAQDLLADMPAWRDRESGRSA